MPCQLLSWTWMPLPPSCAHISHQNFSWSWTRIHFTKIEIFSILFKKYRFMILFQGTIDLVLHVSQTWTFQLPIIILFLLGCPTCSVRETLSPSYSIPFAQKLVPCCWYIVYVVTSLINKVSCALVVLCLIRFASSWQCKWYMKSQWHGGSFCVHWRRDNVPQYYVRCPCSILFRSSRR
jgi:hypothetical protein